MQRARGAHHEVGRVRKLLLHRAAVADGKDVLLARLEPIIDLRVSAWMVCSTSLAQQWAIRWGWQEVSFINASHGSEMSCCARKPAVAVTMHAVEHNSQSQVCSRTGSVMHERSTLMPVRSS